MISIVRIKNLEEVDVPVLREESSREGFKFVERLWCEWKSGTNSFDRPGEALFLAVADGQAIGVCGLNQDPYAHAPRTGRIRRLYVIPAHRGSGVGGDLLRTVIGHARNHLDLLRVRTDAADSFYISNGFRRDHSSAEATHVLELAIA